MLEKMQMVPSLNDAVWQALLPSPQLPFYGSRAPSSDAVRPCLAAVTSMKQDVMSSDVVRRALYSAALDLMSSGGHLQPRFIVPQHHQHLRHHQYHHHQQQQLQQLQVQVQGSGAVLFGEMIRRDQQHSAACPVTSPLEQLHDGM